MFVCGPTVYDFIHLGNARTFTIFDMVAKWLRHRGYDLTYIQNITDIDDKIIRRAAEQNRDPMEYAAEFAHAFRNDMQLLGIDSVSQYARATDHIPQVISQVKNLITKKHVYLIEEDGWYFDLSTFPDYGKLSGRTGLTADDAVSRIDESEKKRNTGDFCVWKLSKPGEPVWEDAELGAGRPGWHIEDTAITEHFFGPQYDLHGGGMDLKFPHHEAEIAQQEAASGQVPFVHYWMHAGFLQTNDTKMSKSLGNFMTVREALKQYEPEVLRFFFLSNHYRSPLEMTDASLAAAQAGVARIGELMRKPWDQTADATIALHAIAEAMDEDFNTPRAFAALFDFIRECNKQHLRPPQAFFDTISRVFGIVPFETLEISDEISALIDERQGAREAKDWTTADRLRDQLSSLGYTIDDTPYGPLVKKQ